MGTDSAEQSHLGGFTPGGDPATFYPELWTWLVKDYGVRSMIDVGCGEGHALDFFASLGCDALGIDGFPVWHKDVVQHDFTQGPVELPSRFALVDLCWSCEFVEHVEDRYVPNFLDAFARAELVLMTHAEPGQIGYHHVNCRDASYWVARMRGAGFKLDDELTETTRVLARATDNPWNHYSRSGMAFKRALPRNSSWDFEDRA